MKFKWNSNLIAMIIIALAATLTADNRKDQIPYLVCQWSPYTLPIGDQSPGNWIFSDTCLAATQASICNPSFLLSDFSKSKYTISCPFKDVGLPADGFIGFVFGYQDRSHFYILDWNKQEMHDPVHGLAEEGFAIKKISASSVDSLEIADLWQSDGTEHSTILSSYYGENRGYRHLAEYEFALLFDNGNFTVYVYDSTSVLFYADINDGSYISGQFGFYCFNSQDVQFYAFGTPILSCGNVNGDESVNISDAVYIINYVFIGGDPPDPMESGDTNCDESVSVSDAVWIINYVFVGGNVPCDTDGDDVPDCLSVEIY